MSIILMPEFIPYYKEVVAEHSLTETEWMIYGYLKITNQGFEPTQTNQPLIADGLGYHIDDFMHGLAKLKRLNLLKPIL